MTPELLERVRANIETRYPRPDGTLLASDDPGVHATLSRVLAREVTLQAAGQGQQEVVESSFSESVGSTA